MVYYRRRRFYRKPTIKRRRSNYKRRSFYRPRTGRRTGRSTTMSVKARQWPLITPPTISRCLQYGENAISRTIASAAYSTGYIYRGNDCYDPNYSGTGHQPVGFDELMNMYDTFTVVGSKITVYTTVDAQQVNPLVVSLIPRYEAIVGSVTNSANTMKNFYGCKQIVIDPVNRYTNKITAYMSTKGLAKRQNADRIIGDGYSGTASSSTSSSNSWYWNIFINKCDGTVGDDTDTVVLSVNIKYYVIFNKRKTFLDS